MRFAGRVPLGSSPSLPHLRGHGLVRRVRRYYEAIRLPTLVHLRRTTLCSLSGPPGDQPGGRGWDLPVLALGWSLALRRRALPSPPPSRFIPALSQDRVERRQTGRSEQAPQSPWWITIRVTVVKGVRAVSGGGCGVAEADVRSEAGPSHPRGVA